MVNNEDINVENVKNHGRIIRKIIISPSILNVPLEEIPEKLKEIEDKIDYIHIDVMDGKFVPNQTDGVKMFQVAKGVSSKPLDVHLMVENPLNEIKKYEGAEIITFHIEAVENENEAMSVIKEIKKLSAKVGISVKPDTSVKWLKNILNELDLILVMTVEPGYGGQKLIIETLKKVVELREMGFEKLIEVDGGITVENIEIVKDAGVDVIVSGSAIFKAENMRESIRKIKGI